MFCNTDIRCKKVRDVERRDDVLCAVASITSIITRAISHLSLLTERSLDIENCVQMSNVH